MWYGATSESAAWAELAKRAPGTEGVLRRRLISTDPSRLDLLNLTNSATREALQVTVADLTDDDYEMPQTIAAWARKHGYDGVLAPSAVEAGAGTLAVFAEAVGKLVIRSDAILLPPL